jgi:hypothetical protein
MRQRALPVRLTLALSIAALMSFSLGTAAFAQTTNTPIVRVDPIQSPVSGAVTITGVAVDCSNGQAATRVAVYDGPTAQGTYLADVSMDTVKGLQAYCTGLTASAQIGFTLILDSRRLQDGPRTLTFVATFSGGASATTSANLTVGNNTPPYYGYQYGPSYGSGYYGGGPYYGYYPQYGYGFPYGPSYLSAGYASCAYGYGGYYGYRADSPRAGCYPTGVMTYTLTQGAYGGYQLTPSTNYGRGSLYIPCGLCVYPYGR